MKGLRIKIYGQKKLYKDEMRKLKGNVGSELPVYKGNRFFLLKNSIFNY